MPNGSPVFLTGGTGLVGSHVAALLRAGGRPVRALHRSTSRVDHLRELGCELIEGDLQDGSAALCGAMAGCGALVHAAAALYSNLPWPRIRKLNVEGTAAVFQAAADVGIRRAVHLSSVAVYGNVREPVDEDTPIDGSLRPGERYARSKREAEHAVARIAHAEGLAVTVLRPSAVYGERDRLFTPKLARTLAWPVQPLLGSGRTRMSALYAGNLAHAVVAGLDAGAAGGVLTYNVAEDHPMTQRALYAGLAETMGTRFRPVPLPRPLVLAGARVGEALGVHVPGAEELPLRRAARLAVHDNPYRTQRIRDELGWFAPIALEDALERTARWLVRWSRENQ